MKYKDTTIDSVSDFLFWVKDMNISESNEDVPLNLEHDYGYYRGQSCICWNLKPSVFREPHLDEHSLLKRASLQLWNEICSLQSYLERMIFFQHYGLSTRLLDVTFNPLVALYVACCDESNLSCDGVVYSGFCTESQNPKIAELTAKYVFENELQEVVVGFKHFEKEEKVSINDFLQPIFIQPPINNPRIEAQNGAFIMAPLFDKKLGEGTALLNRKGLDGTYYFDNRRAIIQGEKKESILHELSVLGINSGTIYRGIEEKLKAIVREEKWKSNCFNNIQL